MFIASVVAAGMVRWVGAGEGLAGWYTGAALARVPHCARVPSAWPRAGTVVEAVRFAGEVVATRSETRKIFRLQGFGYR